MRTIKLLVPGFVVLAFALGVYAVPKATDVPRLVKRLKEGDAKTREAAAKELGRIGMIKVSFVKAAIPALLEAAKDKDDNVRMAALTALGQVNPPADKMVPVLIDGLRSPNDRVKAAAATGLGYFGPRARKEAEEAVKELMKLDAELRALDKDAQKKRRNLIRAVRDSLNAIRKR
ncbi:MAG: hypothetical protein KatS3mg105_2600 [Gemmatales bacterium]|nr:MAG: hypothetical protein KatS3mg105_2600 [Gemmatales bacterium]